MQELAAELGPWQKGPRTLHSLVMPATIAASAHVQPVRWEPSSATLTYGQGLGKRRTTASLAREQYANFVSSMPIVCVDVLLQRQNGDMLSVQRHSEPAKGLYWYPGGRLRMGETFASEALRKVRNEIGINNVCFRSILGTFNTVFERSAWGGPTQTVNVLVHATTEDTLTTAGSSAAVLPICGDRRGTCDDGTHALYKWLPLETASGNPTVPDSRKGRVPNPRITSPTDRLEVGEHVSSNVSTLTLQRVDHESAMLIF